MHIRTVTVDLKRLWYIVLSWPIGRQLDCRSNGRGSGARPWTKRQRHLIYQNPSGRIKCIGSQKNITNIQKTLKTWPFWGKKKSRSSLSIFIIFYYLWNLMLKLSCTVCLYCLYSLCGLTPRYFVSKGAVVINYFMTTYFTRYFLYKTGEWILFVVADNFMMCYRMCLF